MCIKLCLMLRSWVFVSRREKGRKSWGPFTRPHNAWILMYLCLTQFSKIKNHLYGSELPFSLSHLQPLSADSSFFFIIPLFEKEIITESFSHTTTRTPSDGIAETCTHWLLKGMACAKRITQRMQPSEERIKRLSSPYIHDVLKFNSLLFFPSHLSSL